MFEIELELDIGSCTKIVGPCVLEVIRYIRKPSTLMHSRLLVIVIKPFCESYGHIPIGVNCISNLSRKTLMQIVPIESFMHMLFYFIPRSRAYVPLTLQHRWYYIHP